VVQDEGPARLKVRVAAKADFPEGRVATVTAGERRLALVNSGGSLFCLDDTCPHSGGPLGEGTLVQGTLRCPWHERHFDLATGRCVDYPKTGAAQTLPVAVEGDDIVVTLPD
jgi:nitrite reductase/ring-hydroxylating ferredoxin subunit